VGQCLVLPLPSLAAPPSLVGPCLPLLLLCLLLLLLPLLLLCLLLLLLLLLLLCLLLLLLPLLLCPRLRALLW
jgi:hypothetical protein